MPGKLQKLPSLKLRAKAPENQLEKNTFFGGPEWPMFRGKLAVIPFFLSFDFSSQDWLLRIGRDQVRALDVPFWEVLFFYISNE